MKILVTGATGQVGRGVIDALLESNYSVIGVSRKQSLLNNSNYTHITTDLSEHGSFANLLSHEVDALVHCAAQIPLPGMDMDELVNINTRIDSEILKLVLNKKCLLIFISGVSIYGLENKIFTEADALNNSNSYLRCKFASEELFDKGYKNTVIFRVSSPYGYFPANENILLRFIKLALASQDLIYLGRGSRSQDFIHSRDIGHAVIKCLEKNVSGLFNIVSGNPISMKNLAKLILDLIPDSKSKIIASNESDKQEGFLAKYSLNKARRDLGFNPMIPLEIGIKNLILQMR